MKQTTNQKKVSDIIHFNLRSQSGWTGDTKEIQDLVADLAVNFQFGWTSVTPVSEMLPDIKEACREAGFPNRRSLHIMIGKMARVVWHGQILEAQTANGFVRQK